MNIRDAALQSGLPAKTIRYYEDIGLIQPLRRDNGYRHYEEAHVHKLRFLQRARSLGFSVEECRRLMSLYEDRHRASADVKAVAKAHLADVDRKIAELQSMRDTLSHLIHACRGDRRPHCPILDDLAAERH